MWKSRRWEKLLKALVLLKKEDTDLPFLKIGTSHYPAGYMASLQIAFVFLGAR